MMERHAKVNRRTKETDVTIELLLEGGGKADVECQDQFLRHMLETLSRYSSFDITVQAEGDNEHHLVEDVAIVLGTALKQALADIPTERIASGLVPMDDALVEVTLDMIDRPYADIDCPNVLYHHFMRSFAMSSGITLHIIVKRGFDDHHIVEASFKALGMALRRAVQPRQELLSTKESPRTRRM